MPCVYPMQGYRMPGGDIRWDEKASQTGHLPVTVDCGYCQGCRIARTRDWAIRAQHESLCWRDNCFITLTYNDENLPERSNLNIRDWQLFAKRLRKKRGEFRFLMCGEYTSTWRPHYHACLFGINFDNDKEIHERRNGYYLYKSKELESIWSNGFVTVGDFNYTTAAYVSSYIMKKHCGKDTEVYDRVDPETGEFYQLKPPFINMSRKKGLGKTFYERFKSDIYPSDHIVHEGKIHSVPRYYDKLLEEEDPTAYARIKGKRISDAKRREERKDADHLINHKRYYDARERAYERNKF